MKSSRIAILFFSAGITTLFGCDSGDSIIALNISADKKFGVIDRLHVKITPNGGSPIDDNWTMVPTMTEGTAGMQNTFVKGNFNKRYTVSFTGAASIDVEAFNASGTSLVHPAPVTAVVEEHETVAAFVKLEAPMAPAGSGGSSSGGSSSGGSSSGGNAGGGAGGAVAGGGGTDAGGNGGTGG